MIFRISRNAVKEGFDTLPAAICYFDRNGLLRLDRKSTRLNSSH